MWQNGKYRLLPFVAIIIIKKQLQEGEGKKKCECEYGCMTQLRFQSLHSTTKANSHTQTHIHNNNLFSEDETRNCLANPLTNSLLCKWPKCLLSQTLLDLHSTHFECISKQDCKGVIRILPASETASHHLNAIIVNSDIMQVS